ncbi:unnamed protein product [Paramecium primaurelia]|uniref:Uncharacterized protein n=1 Tax=Paramecium primaurelia TaxID=5886 RepID=A0A8S1LIX1_PARPR|nr:unnamed protein product [Paramecium primaurelia]
MKISSRHQKLQNKMIFKIVYMVNQKSMTKKFKSQNLSQLIQNTLIEIQIFKKNSYLKQMNLVYPGDKKYNSLNNYENIRYLIILTISRFQLYCKLLEIYKLSICSLQYQNI